MKKNIVFVLLIGLSYAIRPTTEIKLLDRNPHHLQKVANLLIFLSQPPSTSFPVIKEAQENDDIGRAKHDALKIIQKALGPFLDKTITTTYLTYTKRQSERMNECYRQLLGKLKNKRHRTFLYGDKAGKQLPNTLNLMTS